MKKLIKSLLATLIIATAVQLTSCESCTRRMKSISSDFGGGLQRTAVLMDYQGDTIRVWEGKFDIRDQGSDNQIFFDLDGKRIWIQGGIFVSEEK